MLKNSKLSLLVIVFVILFAAFLLVVGRKKQQTVSTPPVFHFVTPTPIPIDYNSSTFTDSGQHLGLSFPQEWVMITSTPGPITTFSFSENNRIYLFKIIPPVGNTIPDVGLIGADDIKEETVVYGNRQYSKRSYLSGGKPILLFAEPVDPNSAFYSFSMQIPQTNIQKYTRVFDQILTNMQAYKNYNPNDILNPPNSSQDVITPQPGQ